ncbi:hypothetical protein EDD11_006372 [Mortierella claussenii]|nr:hypothetical protein EDD11_006372 [Mortierella claussenii]
MHIRYVYQDSIRSHGTNDHVLPNNLSTLVQSPNPSEHAPDTLSVLRQITEHSLKESIDVSIPKAMELPKDIPRPRTLLETNVKYLGFMTYAGLTNQFMALENAAYLALRLNRTLIIPPITTNSHDKFNSNQRWSEFFDLARFTALSGVQAVEWNDVRPLTAEQIEVGRRQVEHGKKHYQPWEDLAENLTCQVIYGFGGSEQLHSTEQTFARQFLFRPQFVRPPPRNSKTEIFDRVKIGAKDNMNMEDIVTIDDLVDRHAENEDQLLFLSHAYKLKDPKGGRPWSAVGSHLHFLPKVTEYAQRLIRHRAPETRWNGKYIAVHIRRGDIWQKCRSRDMTACIVPLGRYAESIEKAYEILGERLPVIITTDSQNEGDHVTMARLGWRRLNHDLYTTEDELGIFGPAMVDAAILADAEMMIGSYSSSMSRYHIVT